MLCESFSDKVQQAVVSSQSNLRDSIGKSKIKIIIPVYNEEKTIRSVVLKIHQILSQLNLSFKIIVIDDCSIDNTKNILSYLPASYQINRRNRGKAFSILRGFTLIDEDEYIVTIDGDGEHCPEDLPALLLPALQNKADTVIGSRFLRLQNMPKGSYLNNHKKFSHLRKFGNWLFSVILFIFTQKFITDSQSGYRVYRPGVLKSIDITSQGFMIDTEITAKLLKKHFKVLEVPIHNGVVLRGSYMKIVKDSVKIFLTIVKETAPKPLNSILAGVLDHL